MKKKIVYVTQWAAKDINKEYPHGWGFEPPIVEFAQDRDPVEVANICREELSNEEFICIGATARVLIDGEFELLGIVPGAEPNSEEWAIKDIDLITDNSDWNSDYKIKEIERVAEKYLTSYGDVERGQKTTYSNAE